MIPVSYPDTAEARGVADLFGENRPNNRLLCSADWKTKRATQTAIWMAPTTTSWRLDMAARTNTHTVLHQQRIAEILYAFPGAQTDSFAKALRKLVATLNVDREEAEPMYQPGFIPDAYRIDPTTKRIEVFEVEVTSTLTANKICKLGWWWFCWDAEMTDWEPVLIVIDRYGTRQEINLAHAYLRSGPFEHLAPQFAEIARINKEAVA